MSTLSLGMSKPIGRCGLGGVISTTNGCLSTITIQRIKESDGQITLNVFVGLIGCIEYVGSWQLNVCCVLLLAVECSDSRRDGAVAGPVDMS